MTYKYLSFYRVLCAKHINVNNYSFCYISEHDDTMEEILVQQILWQSFKGFALGLLWLKRNSVTPCALCIFQ